MEELGDLLFSAVNVARKLKIDPEQALRENNKKFVNRFEKMENLIQKDSKDIKNLLPDELDSYWNKAKKAEKSGEFTARSSKRSFPQAIF